MDPFTAVAVASSAVQAVSSIAGGNAANAQAKAQAREYERQGRDVDLQATQASAKRREELNRSLATLSNTFDSRNIGLGSYNATVPTMAVYDDAMRDEAVENLGFARQAGTYRRQAVQVRRDGKAAQLQGYLGAVKSGLSAASSLQSLFTKAPSGGGLSGGDFIGPRTY